MQNTLLNYFPKNNLEPRDTQIKCLDWLNQNLNNSKYIILQLPTGVGKTHLGLALSEYSKKNLYVSSTNQLLTQYSTTDANLVEMKGMAQYQCNIDNTCSCNSAPCKTDKKIKEECLSNFNCEYYNQRDKFIASKMGLTNYAFMVSSAGCGIFSKEFAETIGKEKIEYDYIICDEAHNLENHLVSFSTIKINLDELMSKDVIGTSYFIQEDELEDENKSWNNILDICTGISDDIIKRLKFLEHKIQSILTSKNSDKNSLKKLYSEYHFLDRLQFPIKILLDHPEKNRWVLEIDIVKNEFKITPINVDFVFKKYLEGLGKKFIFMSATIGDHNVFIKSLGLPKDKCTYYECDSPFEAKKSPIIILERLDLSYKNIDNELENTLKYIEGIAKKHIKDNGIIHSGNYKLARYIYENCSNELSKRLVFKEKFGNVNNTELVNIHESNVEKNISSILLSPSLVEGVDLKDELSRWQVIIKLPFSSLGDKRIKHLANNFPTWYTNDVVKKVIQACGRSTRHNEDFSITYILDKATLYTFSKIELPKWFKNRMIVK